jgi:hypothetical protein
MRIKKASNNEYISAEGIWVRNPFGGARAVDINSLVGAEVGLLMANEEQNKRMPHMDMEDMAGVAMENVVIASDGLNWGRDQFVLADIPNSLVRVLGVNGSLAKWSMVGDEATKKRTMSFYVVNNPYPECMSFLPKKHRYYPNLMASSRTHPKFIQEYRGQPYMYRPTPDLDYSGLGNDNVALDDYRNPVCAAISLAVKMGARKILLLCCDEAFEDERPGAVRMKNGLFQYPQQIKCQKIIDKHFFWLKRMGVALGDCSSGIDYENAEYIAIDEVINFFTKDQYG